MSTSPFSVGSVGKGGEREGASAVQPFHCPLKIEGSTTTTPFPFQVFCTSIWRPLREVQVWAQASFKPKLLSHLYGAICTIDVMKECTQGMGVIAVIINKCCLTLFY